MNVLGNHSGRWPALTGIVRGLVAAVLASALAAGCDHPFEPFRENDGAPFSLFGYLDLKADTQWIRVMPVRQNLLLAPEPIDAVVTLEHLGSGRVVTLKDSLFRFADPRLEGVAYAYNFWTRERLEPGASYRLKAVRSDGASTTATLVMPEDLEFSFLNDPRVGPDIALLQVRAEHVLFVEMSHAMSTREGDPAGSIVARSHWPIVSSPGRHGIGIDALIPPGQGLVNMVRQEIRLAVARSDWPFHSGMPDLDVTLPGKMPSNVENGFGFVGGVAIRTIPFHRCRELAPRADRDFACTITFNAQSAFLEGRVIRACGDPHPMADIHLTERFASGGAVRRSWKTGWHGEYRFEGIEPGADLVLNLGPGTPEVELPRLAPAERYIVEDISVPLGC